MLKHKAEQKVFFLILIFLACLSGVLPTSEDSAFSVKRSLSKKAIKVAANGDEHVSQSQVQQIAIGQKQYLPLLSPTIIPSKDAWGVAKQVDEHSWTMRVGEDQVMATPHEIFDALNVYRQRNGRGSLSWDDGLANYAQKRAGYFASIGTVDGHKGFSDFLNNEDGFHKLGFAALGENASFGYRLQGVHIIEWVYASDKPHNDNQLSSNWSHVGIGVSGTATGLIFGGRKL
jgi:uncharacterized protein YkwD